MEREQHEGMAQRLGTHPSLSAWQVALSDPEAFVCYFPHVSCHQIMHLNMKVNV